MAKPAAADDRVVGVILAGGRSRRMDGRDKALLSLGGRPLIARVAERLAPQVHRLLINANGDAGRFSWLALPVVADASAELEGPLAGMLAGMAWAATNVPTARWIATVPADTPFFPRDLVARLRAGGSDANTIALARSNGTIHQVVGLIPMALRENLAEWLAATDDRAVKAWQATVPTVALDFPSEPGFDPFFNINTPEDLARAEVMVARAKAAG